MACCRLRRVRNVEGSEVRLQPQGDPDPKGCWQLGSQLSHFCLRAQSKQGPGEGTKQERSGFSEKRTHVLMPLRNAKVLEDAR